MILSHRLFHAICVKDYQYRPDDDLRADFDRCFEKMPKFFRRFNVPIEVRGKAILEIGTKHGAGAIWLAKAGAGRVIGVDIEQPYVDFGQRLLHSEYPHLAGIVDLKVVRDLEELPGGDFDVIVSKDSFEHYADPDAIVAQSKRLLTPDGKLFIGFGPLWKSPFGGHISYMTRLPWAHLLFSERVIMTERKRFRPHEDPTHFEDMPGGLNRMTLLRFERIMGASGMRCVSFRANASERRVTAIAGFASRIPMLREYFTANLYSVWQSA